VVTPKMLKFMQDLWKVIPVGIVGGSDLVKISEQLGSTGHQHLPYLNIAFSFLQYNKAKHKVMKKISCI
nr:phosphomannomutase isoform X1 [Tanacetum cinerariifolium]